MYQKLKGNVADFNTSVNLHKKKNYLGFFFLLPKTPYRQCQNSREFLATTLWSLASDQNATQALVREVY